MKLYNYFKDKLFPLNLLNNNISRINKLIFLLVSLSLVSCGLPKDSVSRIYKEPKELERLRTSITSENCLKTAIDFDYCIKNNLMPKSDWIFMGTENWKYKKHLPDRIHYWYISNPRRPPFSDDIVFNYLSIIIDKEFKNNYKLIYKEPGSHIKFNCRDLILKQRFWVQNLGDYFGDLEEEWTESNLQEWGPNKIRLNNMPNYKTLDEFKKSKYYSPYPDNWYRENASEQEKKQRSQWWDIDMYSTYKQLKITRKNYKYICDNLIKEK